MIQYTGSTNTFIQVLTQSNLKEQELYRNLGLRLQKQMQLREAVVAVQHQCPGVGSTTCKACGHGLGGSSDMSAGPVQWRCAS